MKRIVFWFLSTASVVVLLFGYHTSTSGPQAVAPPTGSGSVSSTPTPSPAAGAGSGGDGTDTGERPRRRHASSSSSTVTGDVASTQWGPVQVQLTLQSGKITDVNVLQYPNGNHRTPRSTTTRCRS